MSTITEADFQQRVTDYCDLRRVRWHHETDSRRSKAGFPDLVLCGPGGVAFIELKTRTGVVRTEQAAWLDALSDAGQLALVMRPQQWDDLRELIDTLAAVGDV